MQAAQSDGSRPIEQGRLCCRVAHCANRGAERRVPAAKTRLQTNIALLPNLIDGGLTSAPLKVEHPEIPLWGCACRPMGPRRMPAAAAKRAGSKLPSA
jgi:hypothetical protein